MNERREPVNTSLRLPGDLHDRLRVQSSRQDRSAHYLILRYIRQGLAADERAAESEDQ